MSQQTFAQKVKNPHYHPVTVEFSPPKGTDVAGLIERVQALGTMADAINIPDSQRAILKMSSLAASKLVQDETGIEAVWQLTTRDRNLLALQGDLMGAWALGLHNVLALTGDPVQIGDHAHVAKPVSHLDSLRLVELIQGLNKGLDATGKELPKSGTQFCVGAALNPHRMSRDAQRHRLAYKLAQGIDFIQTQPIYDKETLEETVIVLQELCEIHHRPIPKLLVGIIPPKSAEFARFMNQKIVGVSIPESFIQTLEKSAEPAKESIRYCADLVAEFTPLAGGFHFMPVGMEKHAPALLQACFQNATGLKRLKLL